MESRYARRLAAWWSRWRALPGWVRSPALLTAVGLLLGASLLGHMTARLELRALRAEKAELEHANRALREAAPRGARRAPAEPEPEAAASPGTAPVGPPAGPALRRRIARLEVERAEAREAKEALEERVTRLREEGRTLEKSRDAARERASRLAARVTELERRAERGSPGAGATASAPAAPEREPSSESGASAPASRELAAREDEAGGCTLQAPEFVLRGAGGPVRRLGGRLELALHGEGDGLALALGGVSGRRYPLGDPPQRFAFECAGEPYVVSVCRVERSPPTVRGVIAPGGLWRGACRERAPVGSGATR